MGVPREVEEMIRAAYDQTVPPEAHRRTLDGWRCRVDGKPYPCPVLRKALLEDYEGEHTALVIRFAGMLDMACRDLPGVPAGEVWAQLLGWIPRPSRGSR